MKTTVTISRPMDKVVGLFMDHNHLKEWKTDLTGYEDVGGIPGEQGSVTKLVFKRNVLYETIVSNNLPAEIIMRYEHKQKEKIMMIHTAKNRFRTIAENVTLLESETEIITVPGFFMKLVIKMFASQGEKYAKKQLDKFKVFAEQIIPA
jgi:hypothetical protein